MILSMSSIHSDQSNWWHSWVKNMCVYIGRNYDREVPIKIDDSEVLL